MIHCIPHRHRIPSAIASCALLLTANIESCQALLTPSTAAHHRKLHTTQNQRRLTAMLHAQSQNLVSVPQAIQAFTSNSSQQDAATSRNVFIDGSWYMPADSRNARSQFQAGPRIPAARFFDIDDIAPSPRSSANPKGLPHMKPCPKQFAVAMDLMDITPHDVLYVYANNEKCPFSHRAYWTLRSAGHDPAKVKLIQGSLAEWEACGGELDNARLSDEDERLFRMPLDWEERATRYICLREGEERVVDMDQVRDIVTSPKETAEAIVVDARSAGRFYGREPEPRPGLRGGHMPGSLNVPFLSLLDEKDLTKFRPMEQVRQIFVEAGIPPHEGNGPAAKVICSCGSGVTAAALAVALEECGLRKREDIYIYDGSWIEWGGDDQTPIVKDDRWNFMYFIENILMDMFLS
ncbi:hypothetical protein HJC23_013217 [Cyclotella cryptica]|uniref:Rhodanese domain-containing protein n=1 Tax=Cyclotella cryptica TaxID=29204 RepID=A0ABD3QC91_9STRA|eukprot:CCRYP_006655-RA/>CCRYP_006655-RA protein AED:0.00 eAED:0.00 QI:223/-1/1/1/-1/1/1/242/406